LIRFKAIHAIAITEAVEQGMYQEPAIREVGLEEKRDEDG